MDRQTVLTEVQRLVREAAEVGGEPFDRDEYASQRDLAGREGGGPEADSVPCPRVLSETMAVLLVPSEMSATRSARFATNGPSASQGEPPFVPVPLQKA